MRQVISREVAITEVWLDRQAELREALFPRLPAKVWVSELGKATVWFLGLVLLLLCMALLAPESRADSVLVNTVADFLTENTTLPLAVGVDQQLAKNLLIAQQKAWGDVWQIGSLEASEEGVLKSISLYVWPGGPSLVTNQHDFPVVWISSRIAIDTGLSVGFDRTEIDFGEVSVSTPEPATWATMLIGLVGIGMIRWGIRRTMADRIVARLRAHTPKGLR